MNVKDEVRKIIADILKVDEKSIQKDTAIGDIPSWDSLNQIRILTEVESKYEIEFTPDDLVEMENFSDIVEAVNLQVGK